MPCSMQACKTPLKKGRFLEWVKTGSSSSKAFRLLIAALRSPSTHGLLDDYSGFLDTASLPHCPQRHSMIHIHRLPVELQNAPVIWFCFYFSQEEGNWGLEHEAMCPSLLNSESISLHHWTLLILLNLRSQTMVVALRRLLSLATLLTTLMH